MRSNTAAAVPSISGIGANVVMAVTSFVLGMVLSYYYVHSNYEVIDEEFSDDDDENDEKDDIYDKESILLPSPEESSTDKIYDAPDLDIRLLRKAEAVLQKRTDKIIIVVERCTNDHNYSAILRTAEALGIQTICLIDPPPATTVDEDGTVRVVVEHENDSNDSNGGSDELLHHDMKNTAHNGDDHNISSSNNNTHHNQNQPHDESNGIHVIPQKVVRLSDNERKAFMDHRKFAQNATQWLTIREFKTATECIHTLRTVEQYQIWVTDLSQEAIPLTKYDLQQYHNTCRNTHDNTSNHNHNNNNRNNTSKYNCWPLPEKIAIVMGTEAVGCSVEMLHGADVRCYLPLYGFADSLNLSVATALVLQQILHFHPNYIGNMSLEQRHLLRTVWYPKLAQQRLMSARTKKQYRAVQKQIETCQRLQLRYDVGEVLTSEQIIKMQRISVHQQTLIDLEQSCSNYTTAHSIVQEYIDHPPTPLSDLRRANIHRVTFVGKNIKKKHEHHWKDMIAISNVPLPKMTTASFFRNRRSSTDVDE